jgi:fatty-acid peroxygenase
MAAINHPFPRFDDTLSLLAEGYRFMPRRFDALGADIFTTRLMLRRAVCMRGDAATRLFYEPGRFTRRRPLPPVTLTLLQDVGSAFLMDGTAHRHRKELLLSILDGDSRAQLVRLAEREWSASFARWPGMRQVVLQHAAEAVLCRAACAWAGVPLGAAESAQRTADFAAMIDGAGSAGPRNLKAQLLRSRTERWARQLVDRAHAGEAGTPDSPLQALARARDLQGRPIKRDDAAAELINLLRPTVAVARFITFGALAMHDHPEWRERLASGDDAALTMFTQEVRRFYPFIPAVGGRATARFDWAGVHFDKGTWVLLDLYGTNHHPGLWGDPEVFRPERFAGWHDSGYALIAQGGGDYLGGHRCAGEPATVELMKSALHLLASRVRYRVPQQDFRISLARMPTLPASGFVVDSVRLMPGV